VTVTYSVAIPGPLDAARAMTSASAIITAKNSIKAMNSVESLPAACRNAPGSPGARRGLVAEVAVMIDLLYSLFDWPLI
jgi:hypothetical protein